MTSPLVQLRNVTKVFYDRKDKIERPAIESVSLDIRAEEFLSLVGPSGCGKSTLLRLIAGLSQPSSGEITSSLNQDSKSNDLACVFQEPTLLPWKQVWENVYLPLRLQGVSRSDARPRIDEAIKLVGLEAATNKYPRELSGGMKMRVSIARSLVTRPKLLLMDEPFAALDELSRQRLNDELLSLQQKFGFSILFITHSVFESVYLSDRVLVMSSGPGTICAEIPVNLSKPRNESLRYGETYGAICSTVSQELSQSSREISKSTEDHV